ncbi:MAG: membrane protein insertase YidC [Desulfosarcinaceae bacterium]
MEQKNLLIAIALSFLIFLGWSVLFAPKPVQKKADLESTTNAANETQPSLTQPKEETKKADATPLVQPGQETNAQARPAKTITVNTPLYTMVLTERGAAIKSMVLKKFHETVGPDSPFKQVVSPDLPGGTALLSSSGDAGKALETAHYSMEPNKSSIAVENTPVDISFKAVLENGLQVEKTFTFSPDSYLVNQKVTLYNGSDQAFSQHLAFVLQAQMKDHNSRYAFEGPSCLVNNKLEQVKIKDIGEKEPFSGKVQWVAIESRYFMSSLVDTKPIEGKMAEEKAGDLIRNILVLDDGTVAPHSRKSIEIGIYIGPKSLKILKALGNGLERAIDFGWFDFIAKPCLWFMNLIYSVIPNYGVAIIILTIVTRMIFWPLATKSYKSMSEMRKIQPLMKEVREKYKDDKTKMNQEMMALYRTYKINPMGGCLPMLIQLPVFFALYRMLYQVIELRHAPFILWINDLSAPSRLGNFSFKIPLMDPPYGIPVLVLIMGATMLWQQKMTPSPGDPTQAKMMMLMPVVFTFIFINFPSGLVLYWMVSNLLSIAQQYYTQKKTA